MCQRVYTFESEWCSVHVGDWQKEMKEGGTEIDAVLAYLLVRQSMDHLVVWLSPKHTVYVKGSVHPITKNDSFFFYLPRYPSLWYLPQHRWTEFHLQAHLYFSQGVDENSYAVPGSPINTCVLLNFAFLPHCLGSRWSRCCLCKNIIMSIFLPLSICFLFFWSTKTKYEDVTLHFDTNSD